MDEIQEENKRLFEELGKYDVASKEYNRVLTQIFSLNTYLVPKVVKRYKLGHEHEIEDLCSTGNIGLVKAIKGYDLSKNVKFSTFAFHCIKNALIRSFESENKCVKAQLFQDIVDIGKDGKERPAEETLKSDIDVEEFVVDKDFNSLSREYLKKALSFLSKKQKLYYEVKYFSENRVLTHKEVAEILKTSIKAVNAGVERGLKTLKKHISSIEDLYQFDVEKKMDLKIERGELKNLIQTRLSHNQSKVLLAMYYSPQKKLKKQICCELGLKYETYHRYETAGIKKLVDVYDIKEDDRKITKEDILKTLKARDFDNVEQKQ